MYSVNEIMLIVIVCLGSLLLVGYIKSRIRKGKTNKIELAYMAGLFDGEGCISISSHKDRHCHLHCIVNIAGKEIPDLFKADFGGCVIKIKKAKDYHQQVWCWTICSNNAVRFLFAILPYWRIKTEEAKLAIEFQGVVNGNKRQRLSDADRKLRFEFKDKLSALKVK